MLYRSKIVLDVIRVTLRVLDGSGVILELVSSNIRRYLKAREDTVKSIVQVDGRIDIVCIFTSCSEIPSRFQSIYIRSVLQHCF